MPSAKDGSYTSSQAHPSLPDESLRYCVVAARRGVDPSEPHPQHPDPLPRPTRVPPAKPEEPVGTIASAAAPRSGP